MDDRAADPARHVPPPVVPEQEAPGAAGAPAEGPAEAPGAAGAPAEGPAETPAGPAWPQAPAAGPASPAWPPAPPVVEPARPWPEAPASAGAPATRWPEVPAARPGSAGGPASIGGQAGPSLRASAPGEPFYLPGASWRWAVALVGLVVGAAPQALLTVLALVAGTSSSDTGAVSGGSALALAVGSLVIYGWEALAAWLFSLRSAGRSLVLWGFRRPNKAYFWVVPLGLVAVYAVSIAHDLIVNPEQQAIVSEFPHSAFGAAMFILVAVVMAPLFEEIVFRGFLFRGFANSWGWMWGALASAAIFGAAHLQLDVFLPLAALGFVLAWAYHRTGSLWTCITMHALFNLIAVAAWAFTS
jgi:membrane protease YdiL (CAAX protease family)